MADRARERVPADQLLRQAEFAADLAHLVLEQLPQRLDQIELQVLRQPADVVVRLDDGGRPVDRPRLDDIGVQRALDQELRVDPASSAAASNTRMNTSPMRRRFSSGSSTPSRRLRNLLPRVHHDEVRAQMPAERALDALALTLPQHAIVHEDAGQLVADGAVHEGRGDGRIDAARQPADDVTVADLLADALDGVLDERAGCPGRFAAADAEGEVREDLIAARRVRDLGVELHAEDGRVALAERGDGQVAGGASTSKPGAARRRDRRGSPRP
jgi:hypothetical protein